ncbi:MAG: C45 family autoproteolytic acyltransferase/hydrolase [Planctomycetota bacterium]|nr:C45 family autoproteolytic acyltransferase/hydrolase [Planctomycetota bacterium]
MSSDFYPYLEVSGSPYEMGRQHGEALPDLIRRFIEMIMASVTSPERSIDKILERTHKVIPLLEEHCPNLLEEIRGLAAGANISFEEAVLLQLRGEVANIPDGDCTTYAISGTGTSAGQLLIGQNSDMGEDQEEVGIVLKLIPESGPRILMWTFAGHLGYHGMNSEGVAHFANALGGGPKWKFGLSHYPLKRMMLEQRTVKEVLALFDSYPVASSGNYVLSGGCRNYCNVEVTPEGYAAIGPGEDGFIAHTNHFLGSPWACTENYERSTKDSFPRLNRMRSLIQSRFGQIEISDVKEFLSDHDNGPASICRHTHEHEGSEGGSGKTVCALIAEPEAGKMHVCKGNPCRGRFRSFEV